MVEALVDVQQLERLYGNPRSWWYQAAESGRVPSYRIGKYRKFRVSEIEAWLAGQREGTHGQGEASRKELAGTGKRPGRNASKR